MKQPATITLLCVVIFLLPLFVLAVLLCEVRSIVDLSPFCFLQRVEVTAKSLPLFQFLFLIKEN